MNLEHLKKGDRALVTMGGKVYPGTVACPKDMHGLVLIETPAAAILARKWRSLLFRSETGQCIVGLATAVPATPDECKLLERPSTTQDLERRFAEAYAEYHGDLKTNHRGALE